MSNLFARPPTGGAFSFILSLSPCQPEILLLAAFVMTLTSSLKHPLVGIQDFLEFG